jgi:hypothetical protein
MAHRLEEGLVVPFEEDLAAGVAAVNDVVTHPSNSGSAVRGIAMKVNTAWWDANKKHECPLLLGRRPEVHHP